VQRQYKKSMLQPG